MKSNVVEIVINAESVLEKLKMESLNFVFQFAPRQYVKTGQYYPYGKILREYRSGGANVDRYQTTMHERDDETGLDNRGARLYDADVARFLSLDPEAEKLPEWSPYNYVLSDPANLIDPDGKLPILPLIWMAYEIGSAIYDAYDAYSTVTNKNSSTTEKAVAVGSVVVGAILPGGGYGTAGKAISKVVKKADDAVDAGKSMKKLKESAETVQEAHRQIQKQLKKEGAQVEKKIVLKDGKVVRKDAVRPDGTKVIIKPDTPSGRKSANRREKLMQDNGHKTEKIYYDPKDPKYKPESPTYIGPKKTN